MCVAGGDGAYLQRLGEMAPVANLVLLHSRFRPAERAGRMDEALAASVAQPRFRTVLLGLFATAAMLSSDQELDAFTADACWLARAFVEIDASLLEINPLV